MHECFIADDDSFTAGKSPRDRYSSPLASHGDVANLPKCKLHCTVPRTKNASTKEPLLLICYVMQPRGQKQSWKYAAAVLLSNKCWLGSQELDQKAVSQHDTETAWYEKETCTLAFLNYRFASIHLKSRSDPMRIHNVFGCLKNLTLHRLSSLGTNGEKFKQKNRSPKQAQQAFARARQHDLR